MLWGRRSIHVGEHDRETGAAGLVGVADGLQGVKALAAGAGDDDADVARKRGDGLRPRRWPRSLAEG